jgi:hypothetical protein
MNATVSHDRNEETIEAKTLWFRSLTLEERMEMLCTFTDFVLTVNPGIVEQKDMISSKRAAGRPVDLEDVRLLELKE